MNHIFLLILLITSKVYSQSYHSDHTFCAYGSINHILKQRMAGPLSKAYCEPPVIFKNQHFNIHFQIDQNNVDSIEVTGNWAVYSVQYPSQIPLTKIIKN